MQFGIVEQDGVFPFPSVCGGTAEEGDLKPVKFACIVGEVAGDVPPLEFEVWMCPMIAR
jgi:hypothetical protein